MTIRVTKPEFNLREKISELDKPSGIKGNDLLKSETTQDARNLIGAGRKNKLLNGDMKINQRGSSFTSVGSSANTFTLDRWKFYVQNSTARFTVTKDSDSPDDFGGSMKIECTTTDTSLASTDEVYLEQRLEGQDLQDFAKGTTSAKEYTLSFYVKTNRTGTYIVNLLSRDNTTGTVSAEYTVSNTNWNRYTVTFPADTNSNRKDDNDNGEALRVLWWFVAGSAVNSPSSAPLATTWRNSTDTGRAAGQINFADSTSNEFFLTGCQLEVGRNVTEFEHLSFAEELALCKRYFQSNFPTGVAPQNAYYTTTSDLAAGFNGVVSFSSNNARSPWVMFHPKMNHQPDVTLYSASTSDDAGKWSAYKGSWDSGSSNSIDYFGDQGFGVRYGAGGHAFVIGEAYLYRGMWAADAEL